MLGPIASHGVVVIESHIKYANTKLEMLVRGFNPLKDLKVSLDYSS